MGIIRRARGLRGEVAVELLGSKPERFVPGLRVFLSAPADRQATVESSWVHGDQLVLKFEGVDTRNASEPLRGSEVRIPAEERPPAPDGEYYFSDLIGCRVETTEGRVIGIVRDCHDFGAAPLLEVAPEGGREMLIPFAEGLYREVDLAGRRIVMDLPEGLEDL